MTERPPSRGGRSAAAPQYLTISEVCEELRITRATLMQLIAAGEIQASLVGSGKGRNRRYRIPAAEPARYIAANRVDGPHWMT